MNSGIDELSSGGRHPRTPEDYIARWMGRCRMLKQIALSTFSRISYTFIRSGHSF
jgi:hypothetical protein